MASSHSASSLRASDVAVPPIGPTSVQGQPPAITSAARSVDAREEAVTGLQAGVSRRPSGVDRVGNLLTGQQNCSGGEVAQLLLEIVGR